MGAQWDSNFYMRGTISSIRVSGFGVRNWPIGEKNIGVRGS